jgi:hypothetical protein
MRSYNLYPSPNIIIMNQFKEDDVDRARNMTGGEEECM